MLYRPEAFDRLTDTRWGERRVRAAIADIVADAERGLRGPKLLWPADPWDSWHATSPMKNLYVGAAGVLWALADLRALAETRLDLGDLAARNLELFRARPDFMRGVRLPEPCGSAFLTGETGILLVAYRLAPSAAVADDLLARVGANVDNEADEIMWGSPGTLVAARLMHEWTGEERWREAAGETAEALWSRRDADGLWTQRLYGQEYRGLSPPHGLVGNVQALLPHLDAKRRRELTRTTNEILARSAHLEAGVANWPPVERPRLAGPDGQIRLQWCCGAPGIVIASCGYLDEELLLAGAELVWRAGPHGPDKGPSICHGTAGNGYALLAAFARTGDERWLRRARRFAVHALEQAARGRSRYSLWTGGLGVALYAAACLEARGPYPVLV
ncbi:MAG TPA: LanC-like protein [Gaiellaceae bacterium]